MATPNLHHKSVLALVSSLSVSMAAFGWEGLAIRGEPKYVPGVQHLDYVRPDAPKGGRIVIGWHGTFDTLNPMSNKGISPILLDRLVMQGLGFETKDEVSVQYPELAESFKVAPDDLSMIVTLQNDAQFSDGSPVRADDIVFSFELSQSDQVPAIYKSYWADVKKVSVVDPLTVKVEFARVNPELAAIVTQLTVFPKHVYGVGDFNRDFNEKIVGSGPYTVSSFKLNSHIVYKRNPNFWAQDDLFFRGRFNFDEVVVNYYKDQTAMIEAFKKGEFDFYYCNSSKVWAVDLSGKAFEQKWIRKELWPTKNNEGSQAFHFNLRNKFFQDIRVRKALALAFDFKWANETLFFNQYIENESFFENSTLKATGLPEGEELKILTEIKGKFPQDFPEEALTQPMGWLTKEAPIKKRLEIAMRLLKQAGYAIKEGKLSGPDGGPIILHFLEDGPTWSRILEPYASNLKRIGVDLVLDVEDESVYQKRLEGHQFDMVVVRVGQTLSPGNEQINYWGSSSADKAYSRNHAGLKSPAVDFAIDKLIYATTRGELELYTRVLDRLLYHMHFVVHNWHMSSHRVAFWEKFARPENVPFYYQPFDIIETMWFDTSKANRLEQSRTASVPFKG